MSKFFREFYIKQYRFKYIFISGDNQFLLKLNFNSNIIIKFGVKSIESCIIVSLLSF